MIYKNLNNTNINKGYTIKLDSLSHGEDASDSWNKITCFGDIFNSRIPVWICIFVRQIIGWTFVFMQERGVCVVWPVFRILEEKSQKQTVGFLFYSIF